MKAQIPIKRSVSDPDAYESVEEQENEKGGLGPPFMRAPAGSSHRRGWSKPSFPSDMITGTHVAAGSAFAW